MVIDAVAASRRPPPPGEERPYLNPGAYIDRDGWLLVYRVVDHLQKNRFDLYSRFLHERTIAGHVVDFYVSNPGAPTTLAAVVAELERIAAQTRKWLVQIPIGHAWPAVEVTDLDPRRTVIARTNQEREWHRFGSSLSDPWAVHRILGDDMMIRPRWLNRPSPDFVDVDTRWSAALISVEEGTEELAVDVALARARIAVAVWTLLKRPRPTTYLYPAWPVVCMWAPAPYLVYGTMCRPFSERFGAAKTMSGNYIRELGFYRLPSRPAALTAPFAGMTNALANNDAAIALLAAARWLYVADHEPNPLTRPERLFCVYAAREALCQRGLRGQGNEENRWAFLVSKLRIRGHLRRLGFTTDDIEVALNEWSTDVRNVTAHRADSILMALDFQTSRLVELQGKRAGVKLGRTDLALAVLTARWPILLEAMRYSARKLLEREIANGWDAVAFHSHFEPSGRRKQRSR